ncbi:hypothetical protein JHK82_027794 [Glycine max]|nr:hypothetical protein JHK82_027794 [Glycine max]
MDSTARLKYVLVLKKFLPRPVLRKLVDDASKFLNDKVTKVVVTVPAYFNDSQRTVTKDVKNNEAILVFDLRGGTFDDSMLEVGDGVFKVLSTSRDTHLGGDDLYKASVLVGDVSNIVLLDVTPLSLGLETIGGVMKKIIPRNATLPTSKSETSVEINVLQGEREFVRDNKSRSSFRLDGIPLTPCGVPRIEVKLDINVDDILSITAIDKGTRKKQDITITSACTLPSNEVEKESETLNQEIQALERNRLRFRDCNDIVEIVFVEIVFGTYPLRPIVVGLGKAFLQQQQHPVCTSVCCVLGQNTEGSTTTVVRPS